MSESDNLSVFPGRRAVRSTHEADRAGPRTDPTTGRHVQVTTSKATASGCVMFYEVTELGCDPCPPRRHN
jgi:hypothetical protein